MSGSPENVRIVTIATPHDFISAEKVRIETSGDADPVKVLAPNDPGFISAKKIRIVTIATPHDFISARKVRIVR